MEVYRAKQEREIDYRPALYAIRNAIDSLSIIQLEGMILMSNNFERLNAAVTLVGLNVAAVAEAIRNPAIDNNDQAVIDALAGQLEAAASILAAAKVEEDAEDGTAAPAPEPTPEPEAEPTEETPSE